MIAQGEGQFKRSFADQNGGIESLCAFVHADGGTVFFGVTDEGDSVGADLGRNTLEYFANTIQSNTHPPLTVSVEEVNIGGKNIVAATVQKAGLDELFYAFGRPYIRVGKTNQVMTPPQQRARVNSTQDRWAEERDRPRFEATLQGVTQLETRFQPTFKIGQVAGDYVPNLEWRMRGPRFQMEWKQASGASLDRAAISATFDLTVSPREDDVVGIHELGIEIRFRWHGQWRHEVHRWPIARREFPTKVLWEIGGEIIPPVYYEDA